MTDDVHYLYDDDEPDEPELLYDLIRTGQFRSDDPSSIWALKMYDGTRLVPDSVPEDDPRRIAVVQAVIRYVRCDRASEGTSDRRTLWRLAREIDAACRALGVVDEP
jgi:hypothetical protein